MFNTPQRKTTAAVCPNAPMRMPPPPPLNIETAIPIASFDDVVVQPAVNTAVRTTANTTINISIEGQSELPSRRLIPVVPELEDVSVRSPLTPTKRQRGFVSVNIDNLVFNINVDIIPASEREESVCPPAPKRARRE